MSAHLAQAVGTLETTPFADLLIRAHDTRATGTLVLEDPSGARHGVFFSEGHPERAKVLFSGAHLGELLVESGRLAQDIHQRTLERAMAEHVLHGRLLVSEGILSEDVVQSGLREQLMRQLVWLFGQPGATRFGYFDGANFLAHWGAPSRASVELLELLWLGIRDHAKPFDLEHALARLGGRRIELRRDVPPGHFDFLGNDAKIVERLRAQPTRVPELLAEDPASEARTRRVLCFLVLTRSLELDVPSAPPLGLKDPVTVNVPPAPPLPTFPESTAPANAPPPAGGSAARRPVEPHVPRKSANVIGAQIAFHKAEVQLARGQLLLALREAKLALESDPEKPEHIALHGYLELLQPRSDVRKALSELERAVRSPSAGTKAHWYRGLVLKHLGRHASALQEFRFVVDEDPGNIDAAREVHIYEERLRKSPKDRLSLAPEPERRRDSAQFLKWAIKKLRPGE
jgi:tetratricopeptide (TPR) repeat protein